MKGGGGGETGGACLGRWDCGTRRLGIVGSGGGGVSQEGGKGGYMVVFM